MARKEDREMTNKVSPTDVADALTGARVDLRDADNQLLALWFSADDGYSPTADNVQVALDALDAAVKDLRDLQASLPD